MRPSFGIDAPPVVYGLAAATAVSATGATLLARRSHPVLAAVAGTYAGTFGSCLGLFLHATRRGKFVVWQGILDDLALTGDETVLDLGCGRGAVLLAAAERVPRGTAVGVDLWRSVDQSGNDEATTRANAEALGVSGRVELRTADISALPLPDASVDVVVSSLAIHNIPHRSVRADAVAEAARVLRPGGRVALVDIREVSRYAERLTAAGLADVRVHDLGWRFWYGPGLGARLVTATKPA